MAATITRLLHEWNCGNGKALDVLVPLVYDHLHQMAARQLDNESRLTIQATELVHEVFLRIVEGDERSFENRVHFYKLMATVMRNVLIDLARRKNTSKRGSGPLRVELREWHAVAPEADLDVEALDRAVAKLSSWDPRLAEIVNLRFYAGLSNPQVSEALGISIATVKREWSFARAWLQREINGG